MDITDLTRDVSTKLAPRRIVSTCPQCKHAYGTNRKAPMTDIDPIVAAVFDVIAERLKQGEVVHLGRFGSFALAKQVFTRAGSVRIPPRIKPSKKR